MKPLIRTYSPVASIFVAFTLAGTSAVHAANDVWIGNTDANFGTLSNWTGSVSPNNNTPVFGVAGTSGATLNNDIVGASYAGLTFNSGASAYTIGGNSFTLTGNIANNSSSLQTINNAMTFTSRQFNAGTGGLALGGTLTVSTALNTGAGAVTLTGATTVDGAAAANGGFFTIGNNAGAATTGSLTLSNGGSLMVNGTTNATKPNSIIGQVSGTYSLNIGATDKSSSGTLTLGASSGLILGNSGGSGNLNVYSGTATINRGTTATTTNGTDTRLIMLGRDSASSTGTVNLNGGILATDRQFVRDGSSGAGSGTANFVFNGGTLKALANQTDWLQSTTATIAGQNNGSGTGTLNTNALALSSVTTTATSTIDANGFSVAINNNISGTGGFNINSGTGTGTVTLGGANTYSGATTVTNSTLALASTGSLASTQISVSSGATFDVSAVSGYTLTSGKTLTNNGTVNGGFTVASGGTLNGSGTFTGAATIAGNLNPGNSPGTVTFTNGLALAAGSNLGWELVANTESGAGTNFDQVLVTGGALTVADGAMLNLNFGGSVDFADGFWTTDHSWTVISFVGNGEEGALTLGTITGGTGDFNEIGSFSTSNDNGNQVLTWTAVPEPTAALLGGLGMLALLRRRRVA